MTDICMTDLNVDAEMAQSLGEHSSSNKFSQIESNKRTTSNTSENDSEIMTISKNSYQSHSDGSKSKMNITNAVTRSPLRTMFTVSTPNSLKRRNKHLEEAEKYVLDEFRDTPMDSKNISRRYKISLHDQDDCNINDDNLSHDVERDNHNNEQSYHGLSVCSGYAGSVSALGSGLSSRSGYDSDINHDGIHEFSGRHHSDRTEGSAQTSAALSVRQVRQLRRKKKQECNQARYSFILQEFRAFLGWSSQGPPSRSEGRQCVVHDPIVTVDRDVELAYQNTIQGDGDAQDVSGIYVQSIQKHFDLSESFNLTHEYSPHQIHASLPWIVFDRENEENMSVSTIHGTSLCMETLPQSCLDYKYDLSQPPKVDVEKASKMEFVYIFLIAVSIITLTVVIVFLFVYF